MGINAWNNFVFRVEHSSKPLLFKPAQKAPNKGCSTQNRMISLSITSSDCTFQGQKLWCKLQRLLYGLSHGGCIGFQIRWSHLACQNFVIGSLTLGKSRETILFARQFGFVKNICTPIVPIATSSMCSFSVYPLDFGMSANCSYHVIASSLLWCLLLNWFQWAFLHLG